MEAKDEGGLSQEDSRKLLRNGQILITFKYIIFHCTIDFKMLYYFIYH